MQPTRNCAGFKLEPICRLSWLAWSSRSSVCERHRWSSDPRKTYLTFDHAGRGKLRPVVVSGVTHLRSHLVVARAFAWFEVDVVARIITRELMRITAPDAVCA